MYKKLHTNLELGAFSLIYGPHAMIAKIIPCKVGRGRKRGTGVRARWRGKSWERNGKKAHAKDQGW